VAQLAFIPIPRYMYPLAPIAMILAAWVACSTWERLRPR
jgi:hypothetical protein